VKRDVGEVSPNVSVSVSKKVSVSVSVEEKSSNEDVLAEVRVLVKVRVLVEVRVLVLVLVDVEESASLLGRVRMPVGPPEQTSPFGQQPPPMSQ
jgi:hypothetical protein